MKLSDFTQPTAQLVEWTHHLPPGSVLDIGTGNGRNALYLAHRGWAVTATDVRQARLDMLMKDAKTAKLKVQTRLSNLLELEQQSDYDLVLCLMVLHFLEAKQIKQAINRLKTATKLGGYCMVTAFTAANPPGTRPYLFKDNELKKFFGTWQIEHYEETYGGWIIPKDKVEPERYVSARIMAKRLK